MLKAFKELDSILRGDATRVESLEAGKLEIPTGALVATVALLGLFYGASMGAFAVIRTGGAAYMQLVASAIKLPLLFFLTLLVTFPSLYVFNALVGSRLSILSVLRLLVAMLGVMLAVLASFGPIVVFFSVSTTSYAFMQLLNVVLAAVAGVLGLAFLLQTLHRLVVAQAVLLPEPRESAAARAPAPEPAPQAAADAEEPLPADQAEPPQEEAEADASARSLPRGALDRDDGGTDRRAKRVFRVWVIVFALVGAQMSWILRPFIGHPDAEFEWFREREGNFFQAVMQALANLLGM